MSKFYDFELIWKNSMVTSTMIWYLQTSPKAQLHLLADKLQPQFILDLISDPYYDCLSIA